MNSVSIAYDRSGRTAESLATVERGLVLNPDFAAFHLTMANLLRAGRDLEDGAEPRRACYRLEPQQRLCA